MTEIKQREQTADTLLRNYKDSVFRLLFSDKEHALELYNAITGSCYDSDAAFRFTTLEEVIMQTKKNDISFLLDDAFIIMHDISPRFQRSCPSVICSIMQRLFRENSPTKNSIKLPD